MKILKTSLIPVISLISLTLNGIVHATPAPIVSFEEQGRTPNQKAIGANLDKFKINPNDDMYTLLRALDRSGNVARGLEQLSPQRYQIYSDIALANANVLTQAIDQRLNNLRSGSESFGLGGLSVSTGDSKQTIAPASGKDGKAPVEQTSANRWGAFLSGDVAFGNLDGRGWQQDSNFTNSGLVAGIDAKLTDALTTGVLFAYSHSDVDLDSQNSNANVDAYSTGLYGGYHEGNFYGNGLATFTRNIYESDRNIDIPGSSRTANGRTAGSQYMVNLDGGYDHPVAKDLTVGPFAGLQYVHMDVNAFTENGAGAANLALNDQSVDSLRSRLGVRMELRKEITASWAAASEVRLAWMHEFANNGRAIVARFSGAGLGSFAVRTDDPERNAALIGLGLNATYRGMLTMFVDYDVQAGQSHYMEQILKGGFKWSF
ncbi:MAG: autotransporter outer membrane beta-barrel domain-containing protein [Verrucomicrobiota bacterium]